MSGLLSQNLLHFGRLLRAAGIPVGPDRILDAVRASSRVDLERRGDFYHALLTVLVNRPEHRAVFDRAFASFWRERGGMQDALGSLLPQVEGGPRRAPAPGAARVARATDRSARSRRSPARAPGVEVVASWSDREALRQQDFAQMTPEESRGAERCVARMKLPVASHPSRRFRPADAGRRIDTRASLRESLRTGGADLPLRTRSPKDRPAPLVLLCDISGSMARYSRMLLHFGHALLCSRPDVQVFVFGTRLTNVTRGLRVRDVDAALAAVARRVPDWSGGTRIGSALRDFNRIWSRRVLATGATLLLVTDGLDRDDGKGLSREADRLHRSCRRLVWLNPLLRYPAFEARARGIRALLPHVDDFRPVHNLASLEELVAALSHSGSRSADWQPPPTQAPVRLVGRASTKRF